MAWNVWLFIFCDVCKPVIIHPVYTISPCLLPDSASSCDISNLADVANVSSLRNLSRRALPMIYFMIRIFVLLSKRLVILVSALVSIAMSS